MPRVCRRIYQVFMRRLPALAFTIPCFMYLTVDIGRQDATAMLLALAEKGQAWRLSLVAVPTGTSVTRFDGRGVVTTPMMGAALSTGAERGGILSASGDITGSIPPGDVVATNVRVNRTGKGDLPITRVARAEVLPEEQKPGVLFNFASAFENVYDAALPEKSFMRPLAPIVVRLDPQVPLSVDNGSVSIVPQLTQKDAEPKVDFEHLKVYAIKTDKDLKRAQYCLTEAVYFESRSESVKGQRAVAQVVLNRVKSGTYPQNVCDVVYQNKAKRRSTACQFSYTCDGFPERVRDLKSWAVAKQVADDALQGKIFLADIGDSTHYHTDWVYPNWRRELRREKKIGSHIFYSMPGVIINGT